MPITRDEDGSKLGNQTRSNQTEPKLASCEMREPIGAGGKTRPARAIGSGLERGRPPSLPNPTPSIFFFRVLTGSLGGGAARTRGEGALSLSRMNGSEERE